MRFIAETPEEAQALEGVGEFGSVLVDFAFILWEAVVLGKAQDLSRTIHEWGQSVAREMLGVN